MRPHGWLWLCLGVAAVVPGCTAWAPPGGKTRALLLPWSRPNDVAALRSDQPALRRWAMIDIMRRGDRDAAAIIRPLLSRANEPEPLNRATAAEAARVLGDAGAVPLLLSHRNDPDALVRAEIIKSLAVLATREALPAVGEHLARDRDVDVRLAALDATVSLGHRAAAPPLLAAMDDRDASVRFAAYAALRRLAGVDHGPRPTLWRRWWEGQSGEAREAPDPEHRP